jgi:hypothetical protein
MVALAALMRKLIVIATTKLRDLGLTFALKQPVGASI